MLKHAIACGLAACALVSCFPQGACSSNPGFVDYCGPGDTTCQGKILDATHWQSGPIEGTWLDFSREKLIQMHFRDAQTGATLSGQFADVAISINVSSSLAAPPNQAVPCAGNNCEYLPSSDGSGVLVKNDTCTDYFVYVVATVIPNATDAGADGDASEGGTPNDGATE